MEQRKVRTQTLPPTEGELIDLVSREIRSSLPDRWEVNEDFELGSPQREGRLLDSVFKITAPDGQTGELVVETKSILLPKDVRYAIDQLSERAGEGKAMLLAARYLSPRVREDILDRGVSFLDATGNVGLKMDRPAILIQKQGANRDPFRKPEGQISSLKGLPASRVVRALVDFRPPWKMRSLQDVCGVSLASISRTIELLDQEGLVARTARGSIENVDWEGLIRRWAEDYSLAAKRRRVARFLAPRGLGAAINDLVEFKMEYAVSGSLAAQKWAPYAEPVSGLVYVRDVDELKRATGLVDGTNRADLIAIEPEDELPFLGRQRIDGLDVVAQSQACVDLLAGAGRNPEEGLELLRWMKSNENEWRRDVL